MDEKPREPGHMRTHIGPFFRRLARSTSGNAMMIVAFGMPALLGAAGYAVEMAQLYAWKRELQHSVDQAAIAGAWALAYDKDTQTYVTRAQQEFDANKGITKTFADADAAVQLGKYGGTTNNSVIVSARATKRLPFSGYLTNRSITVFARAQATFAEGGTYQACLMALKKDESLTFDVGGTADIDAACGLGALSCNPNAISIGENTTVTTDSIVTCGTATVPEGLESKLTEGAGGLTNPFEDLPPPTPENEAAKKFSCKTTKNELGEDVVIDNEGAYHISAGRYTGGLDLKCKVVLGAGIYVIDGGVLDLTDNKSHVTGIGVMFVLRNGAQVKIGGSGNGGYVNLSPMEAADFVGTPNEPHKNLYGGMLVYEDSTGQSSAVDHVFNGNSNVTVRGTMYLPNGDLTINGTGNVNPMCFQLWASTLKINGTASLTTTCTSTETNSAGGAAGGVRLVA